MITDPNAGKIRHMPSLDGLRAFACLLVVFSHINVMVKLNIQGYVLGSSGVLLFFALSGFLMGTLYFQKPATLDSMIKYLIARFSRITPAYYIAILFGLGVAAIGLDQHYHMDLVMMVRSFAFMGSTGVFWSIPPEIQFYLFFLLIWGGYTRAKNGQYALMVLVVLLSVVFIATREMWGGILLPSKYHIFLAGFLGSVAVRHPVVRGTVSTAEFQLVIAAASLAYIVIFITKDNLYSDLVLPLLIGTMVMSFSSSTIFTKILELDFMRMIGNASFSIYLFHEILLKAYGPKLLTYNLPVAVNVAVMLGVSLAVPMVFHVLVERRLHYGTRDLATRLYEGGKARWFPVKIPA